MNKSDRKTKEVVKPKIEIKKGSKEAYEKLFKNNPKKKKEKVKAGYSLDKEVVETIKKTAFNLNISYSEVIERAVRSYVDEI